MEVGRHGYYELCEDTIINNIDNAFSNQKVLLEKLKCEKEGYIRYLQTPYLISLKDIYMFSEDVNKCSNHKKNLPKDTNTNVTNTHVTEVDATLILPITPKQAMPKPSETCRVGSEIICIELERIIEQCCPSPLNLDTVWIALLNQAETNVESYFEKVNEKIIREKNTNKVLDKDKTRYHINNAIEWASSI